VSSLSASESTIVVPEPGTDPYSIRVEGLSVTYRTSFEKKPTLRKTLARVGRRERKMREVKALQNVTMDVPHGSVLGVIGVNGAGKSTLMRTIAGILPPSEGRVEVNGRISTLLALGVGFNSDLSGRENVVLGGLAAGLTREEVAERYEAIERFAGLGEFMDAPMRTYSSGMNGRLAFSVAVNLDPDILLIDEALSVGDARFKRKSFNKMMRLVERSRTIVMVSHGLKWIQRLSTEVAWLHEGKLVMRDDPGTVIEAYTKFLEVDDSDDAAEDDE
jgi:teichoic acid transport system ATP-binding protein